jgi:hypothetical protein
MGMGHWTADSDAGYTSIEDKAGLEWSVVVGLSNQIYPCVYDPPCQTAAECADKHRLNFDIICRRDPEAAGKAQGHYHAKQELRDPLHRIEHSRGWLSNHV